MYSILRHRKNIVNRSFRVAPTKARKAESIQKHLSTFIQS